MPSYLNHHFVDPVNPPAFFDFGTHNLLVMQGMLVENDAGDVDGLV